MAIDFTPQQRRWLDALLVLATVAVGFLVIGDLASIFFSFGDIILIFFLAWLLAFILSPIVSALTRSVPFLSRIGAVIVVYALLLGALTLLVVLVAGALASSVTDFIGSVPELRSKLPATLAPWQQRLAELGFSQIDLTEQANIFLNNLNRYAEQLAGPLQQLAVASLGALGNLIIVLVMSLYIVIDRDRILFFFFRVVPPAFKDQARLLETSVAKSFGGFLRGQAVIGVVYAMVATIASGFLQLPYLPVTSVTAGVLMAIPFFGPFVSWLPPVLVAFVAVPGATLPTLVIMGIGWFVVMNVLQPRLMEEAVGIHPIVVLGSVLIGSKVAGITGAIFGIPIAAVLSAFFFYYLGQARETGPVAERAARRVEKREGRPVRVPREPAPGIDADVDEAHARALHPEPMAHPDETRRPTRPSPSSSPAGPGE
jgi:predicted PurR-regulated permease PerM